MADNTGIRIFPEGQKKGSQVDALLSLNKTSPERFNLTHSYFARNKLQKVNASCYLFQILLVYDYNHHSFALKNLYLLEPRISILSISAYAAFRE